MRLNPADGRAEPKTYGPPNAESCISVTSDAGWKQYIVPIPNSLLMYPSPSVL